MKRITGADLTGTSYRGKVFASFVDMVKTFGLPDNRTGSADSKVRAEWAFVVGTDQDIQNGEASILTIYDYKGDKEITEMMCWHIGGKGITSAEAVELVKENLEDKTHEEVLTMVEGVRIKTTIYG